MDAVQSHAYGRFLTTMRRLGDAKLDAGESALLREAADALLFGDEEIGVVERAETTIDGMRECGRLEAQTAFQLRGELRAIAPRQPRATAHRQVARGESR
jgi:hypothetical protein